jgi:hypothetical protein
VTSGKANHAGKGRWRGTSDSGATVGIEVEHSGVGGWTAQQLDAFDRCAAALIDGLDLTAADYCGHREWALPAGRKPDPGGVDLDAQRRRIATLLAAHQKKTPTGDVMTPELRTYLDERFARLEGGPRRPDRTDTNTSAISLADLLTALERIEGRLTKLEGNA